MIRFYKPLGELCFLFLLTLVPLTAYGVDDLVLEIDGVAGDSTRSGHQNDIDVLEWGWGVSNNSTVNNPQTRSTFQDIVIKKYIDRSTPLLLESASRGNTFQQARLYVYNDDANLPYVCKLITMQTVLVTSVTPSVSITDSRSTETITLNMADVRVHYQPRDLLEPPIEYRWDIVNNTGAVAVLMPTNTPPPEIPTPTTTLSPTVTPTPQALPTPTSTQTPTITPTSVPIFTPTFTASPTTTTTNTPIPPSTPSPTIPIGPTLPFDLELVADYEFDQPTLSEMGWAEIPGGFIEANPGNFSPISFAENQVPSSVDQLGLQVTVAQDEVTFLYASNPIEFDANDSTLLMRMRVRSDGPDASLFLVGIKGNLASGDRLDGSLGIANETSASQYVDSEGVMVTVYQPDTTGIITPVIQVAGSGETTNVSIDRLQLYRVPQSQSIVTNRFLSGLPNFNANPSPTPTRPAVVERYEFSGNTLQAMGWVELPGGFLGNPPGTHRPTTITSAQIPSSQDQAGLSVTVAENDVAFFYAQNAIDVGNPESALLMRASIRANAPGASVFLVGLKGDLASNTAVDGSLALNNVTSSQPFVNQEGMLMTLYEPDEESTLVTPILQVVGRSGTTTVTLDRIEVYRIDRNVAYYENLFHTIPQPIVAGETDSDFDTLTDEEEIELGTNPFSVDSDGDLISDSDEISLNTDPNDLNSLPGRLYQSNPVSYLNAIVEESPEREFDLSPAVGYLNAIVNEAIPNQFELSPVVSYENQE